MNEEIKKRINYLREVHYGASITGEEFEEQLMSFYLLGAKDMREAVKIGTPRYLKGGELRNQYFAKGWNECKDESEKQAQQFIDSLEKGKNN